MRGLLVPAFIIIAFAATPARAADIPEFALDKFYNDCLGGEVNDQARAAYCHCMKDAMRGWTDDDFNTMMMEQLKNPNQQPAIVVAQAKTCADKVLK